MADDRYTIIRKFRGSWPQWYADLDNMDVVYIRIRHGQVIIGQGKNEDDADNNSRMVKTDEKYAGVSDAVDALVELRDNGYYYVADSDIDY